MALAPIIDSLDSVPENLRSEYRPGTKKEGTEGKHVLDVTATGGWALENVQSLKNSLSHAKTERDAAKQIVDRLGQKFSVEEYEAAMKELEELRKGAGSKATEAAIESVKAQLTDKHTKELKARDELVAQRDSEINDLLITSEATRHISDQGGNVMVLLPHVVKHCKVVRGSDGKPKAKVVQEDGKSPRMSMVAGSTADMEIGEFVGALKNDTNFASLFKGTGASGSGGAAGSGSGSGNGTGGAGGQQGGGGGAGSGNSSGNNGSGGAPLNFTQQLRDKRRAEWGQKK